MRKKILHGFTGVFCFAIVTSCGKDVKAPSNKPASAATTTSSAVTQAQEKDHNNPSCSNQGSSGSSSSSGTYTTGY